MSKPTSSSAGWQAFWNVIVEWFCWLIIAVPFAGLEYLSLAKGMVISTTQIVLAILAVSPWILRLLARYFSEFKVGPTGLSGKTREGVINRDEIDTGGTGTARALPPRAAETAPPADSAFDSLIPQAKKVLRTLWKFQVEHFGADDVRRWGFAVGTSAPDYYQFSLGVLILAGKHLVNTDSRGFIFLTDEGISFCKTHSAAISAYPEYYSKFA